MIWTLFTFMSKYCIFERFAIKTNCELCVSLPPLERVELRRLLGQSNGGGTEIFSFLTSVHAESSDAFSKEDVSKIHSTIKSFTDELIDELIDELDDALDDELDDVLCFRNIPISFLVT